MAKHVVLLGFPAFGHMIPLISLAKKLAASGWRVTIAVSSLTLTSLRKRGNLCAADENCFEIFGIEDGITDADMLFIWSKVWSHVIPAVENYVQSISPTSGSSTGLDGVDLIISDAFLTRSVTTAKKRGIPFYLFFTSPIILLNIMLCVDENTPEATTPGRETFLPRGAGLKRGTIKTPIVSYLKNIGLDVGRTMKDLKGILVNSFRALEGDTVELFLSNSGRDDLEIYCVGPVFPDESERTAEEEHVRDKIRTWLDHKRPGSVAYVSFGSVVVVDPAQIHEIGKALVELGTPFIYSIRTEYQAHLPEEIRSQIALQLENPDSPWLVVNWVPQDLILNHAAVQVFLTHCGWNSTVETMFAKKPTCLWPIFGDQMENALIMEKCGLGVLVSGEGDQRKKFISAEEVKQTICKVGGWTADGNPGEMSKSSYAAAAEDWGEKIRAALGPGGSSQKEFETFLTLCDAASLQSLCTTFHSSSF